MGFIYFMFSKNFQHLLPVIEATCGKSCISMFSKAQKIFGVNEYQRLLRANMR